MVQQWDFFLICNSDRTVECEDSEKYLGTEHRFLQLTSPEFKPRPCLRTKTHSTVFRVYGCVGGVRANEGNLA